MKTITKNVLWKYDKLQYYHTNNSPCGLKSECISIHSYSKLVCLVCTVTTLKLHTSECFIAFIPHQFANDYFIIFIHYSEFNTRHLTCLLTSNNQYHPVTVLCLLYFKNKDVKMRSLSSVLYHSNALSQYAPDAEVVSGKHGCRQTCPEERKQKKHKKTYI